MIKKIEEAKIVLACEDDPVLFAEIACMCNNMKLYDWQKELLEAFHKNLKVDCDTRNHLVSIRPKCGITTVYALYALWNSIFKYGFNTLYYTQTNKSGKEFLKIIDTIKVNLPSYFDPDFGGLNKWSVETGNNGKNYVYFKDDEVCRVSYNKKEKSVNLNFGDGMGVDFEFDPEEETFEDFIKFILTRIKEKNYTGSIE